MLIELEDLAGYILTIETLDIVHTALDALLAAIGALKAAADGIGHAFGIIRGDVEAIGAAGLFETAACAGYYGQTATDGLDDRYAKTFVDAGIDKCLGTGIECGQIGIGHTMEYAQAMLKTIGTGVGYKLVGIGSVAAYKHKRNVIGQIMQGLEGKHGVFAGLDGADAQHVAVQLRMENSWTSQAAKPSGELRI